MSNKIIILVVDDNPINRQYFSMALIKAGFEVVLAEDGFDAIKQAKTYDFDIILIDIRMPGMDGYETTTRIKQIPRHIGTPIIATSAEKIDEDKSSLFNDFILKPVSPKQLKQVVIDYCEKEHLDAFNQENALKYAYDDYVIMHKLLAMFVIDLPKQIIELGSLIGSNYNEESCALIHKIRGSCKACGADDLDFKLASLSKIINSASEKNIATYFTEVIAAEKSYLEIISKLAMQ